MRLLLLSLVLPFLALAAYAPALPDAAGPSPLPDTTWTWPTNPENLQVLPADIGPNGLRQVMQNFTQSLGVRCWHCHVGEEGMDFSEFDFVSDANAHKEIAREMMRMTSAINDDLLANIEGLHEAEGRRVTCYTCHRGEATPETTPPSREFRPPANPDDDRDDHDHGDHDHGDDG